MLDFDALSMFRDAAVLVANWALPAVVFEGPMLGILLLAVAAWMRRVPMLITLYVVVAAVLAYDVWSTCGWLDKLRGESYDTIYMVQNGVKVDLLGQPLPPQPVLHVGTLPLLWNAGAAALLCICLLVASRTLGFQTLDMLLHLAGLLAVASFGAYAWFVSSTTLVSGSALVVLVTFTCLCVFFSAGRLDYDLDDGWPRPTESMPFLVPPIVVLCLIPETDDQSGSSAAPDPRIIDGILQQQLDETARLRPDQIPHITGGGRRALPGPGQDDSGEPLTPPDGLWRGRL